VALEQTRSVQVLRNRRRQAEEWIERASWTAIGTAGLGFILGLLVGLSDLAFLSQALPLLSTFFAQGVIGYQLQQRSQWAAWGLMATYAGSFVLTVLIYGVWSGIIIKLVIGYVYVRGWLATLDYEELTRQINEASPS
jgi:hypothetical protein